MSSAPAHGQVEPPAGDAGGHVAVMRVRLLGPLEIETPRGAIPARRTHVLAAALFLALEQRQVCREELGELLWPDVTAGVRQGRMRWLVRQLRIAGVPLVQETRRAIDGRDQEPRGGGTPGAGGHLRVRAVATDLRELPATLSRGDPDAPFPGKLLEGQVPVVSARFAGWLEHTRDRLLAQVLRAAHQALAPARRAAAWEQVERIARWTLQHDPYDEPAGVALMEAIAVERGAGGARRDRFQGAREVARRGVFAMGAAMDPRGRAQGVAMRGGGLGGVPSLVGRSRECEVIAECTRSAAAGDGGGLVIAGPPGMGHSRLLREAALMARHEGMAVVEGACAVDDALGEGRSIAHLVPALLELRGALGASPASVELLREVAAETPAAILRGAEYPRPSRSIASRTTSHPLAALHAALADMLESVAEESPVALVLDDVQWLDAQSAALLPPLLAWAASRPVLWVLGECADRRRARRLPTLPARVLWLEPLDNDAARELACSLLAASGRVTAGEVAARGAVIARRAGGCPALIQALAMTAAGAECAEQGDGDARLLPADWIQGFVDARIGRLSPEALRTLQVLALHAAPASLQALRGSGLFSAGELLDALAELEEGGLVTCDARERLVAGELWSEGAERQLSRGARGLLAESVREWRCPPTRSKGVVLRSS